MKLEQYATKADCGQFVIGNHTKKRPNNLIFGRLYDNRLYDLLELGVESYKSIKAFGAASSVVQTQNKVRPESKLANFTALGVGISLKFSPALNL